VAPTASSAATRATAISTIRPGVALKKSTIGRSDSSESMSTDSSSVCVRWRASSPLCTRHHLVARWARTDLDPAPLDRTAALGNTKRARLSDSVFRSHWDPHEHRRSPQKLLRTARWVISSGSPGSVTRPLTIGWPVATRVGYRRLRVGGADLGQLLFLGGGRLIGGGTSL
jgi:hypothetical protein